MNNFNSQVASGVASAIIEEITNLIGLDPKFKDVEVPIIIHINSTDINIEIGYRASKDHEAIRGLLKSKKIY